MNYNKIVQSNFYNKFFKNINEDKTLFYRYKNDEKTYNDLKNYGAKLFKFFDQSNIKKKVIFTYSNKSFEMYSSIMPIFLQNCIWVPISIHYPIERVKLIMDVELENFILVRTSYWMQVTWVMPIFFF